MCRQVDAPGQGGGADEDFHQTLREKPLHKVAVLPEHACMVDAESITKQITELFVPGLLHLEVQAREGVGGNTAEDTFYTCKNISQFCLKIKCYST